MQKDQERMEAFECAQPGHTAANCPNKKGKSKGKGKSGAKKKTGKRNALAGSECDYETEQEGTGEEEPASEPDQARILMVLRDRMIEENVFDAALSSTSGTESVTVSAECTDPASLLVAHGIVVLRAIGWLTLWPLVTSWESIIFIITKWFMSMPKLFVS